MGIHTQPANTALSAGPQIQYTADTYADILANLATLAGSYVVDLSTSKIYLVQDDQTVVFTKFFAVGTLDGFANVPSLNNLKAGQVLHVPDGYNFIVDQQLGLTLTGDLLLDGDLVSISP